LNCLEIHDEVPHQCPSKEAAFAAKESYERSMRELGVEVDIIVVERDVEGIEWEISRHPTGGWSSKKLGTYWTNGSFP